ncbi:hypothetical protein B0H63DRAFT_290999 [Podospora didyma]|uniref:Uncharacterized protein n=1 Tax=Podospora didyma TaxID=330526 RepID=A0AAE0K9X6_9PEZI|nr:hypothetical protein B0H63DRAFT_290999 [Podospora didyma]
MSTTTLPGLDVWTNPSGPQIRGRQPCSVTMHSSQKSSGVEGSNPWPRPQTLYTCNSGSCTLFLLFFLFFLFWLTRQWTRKFCPTDNFCLGDGRHDGECSAHLLWCWISLCHQKPETGNDLSGKKSRHVPGPGLIPSCVDCCEMRALSTTFRVRGG